MKVTTILLILLLTLKLFAQGKHNEAIYWDILPDSIKTKILKDNVKNKEFLALYQDNAHLQYNSKFNQTYCRFFEFPEKINDQWKNLYVRAFYVDVFTNLINYHINDEFCGFEYSYIKFMSANPEYTLNYLKHKKDIDIVVCSLGRYCSFDLENKLFTEFSKNVYKGIKKSPKEIKEYADSFFKYLALRERQTDSIYHLIYNERIGNTTVRSNNRINLIINSKDIYNRMPSLTYPNE